MDADKSIFVELLFLLTFACLCLLVGSAFARKLKPQTTAEELLFGGAFGYLFLSFSIFILLALKVAYPKSIELLFWLSGLPGGYFVVRNYGHLRSFQLRREIILLPFVLSVLALAFSPELDRDSLVYHVTLPKLYLQNHGFRDVVGNIYSGFPLAAEMPYLIAYAVCGPKGPRLVGFFIYLLTILLIKVSAQRLFHRQTTIGNLVFVSTPTLFFLGGSAYVDLTLSLYIVLGLHLLTELRNNRGTQMSVAVAAGMAFGMAMSTKYHGFALLPILFLFYVIDMFRGRERRFYLVCVSVAIILVIPWLVKNVIFTGNPFYPFFFDLFGGPGWDNERALLYQRHLFSYGIEDVAIIRDFLDYLLVPLRATFQARFDSKMFDGSIGAIYLAVIPLFLLKRKRGSETIYFWLFIVCFSTFWVLGSTQLRFLAPVLVCACVLISALPERFERRETKRLLLVLLLVAVGLNSVEIAGRMKDSGVFRYYSGGMNDSEHLALEDPFYRLYREIDDILPQNARLLMVGTHQYGLYLDREFLADSFLDTFTFSKWLSGHSDLESEGEFKARGIAYLVVNERFFPLPPRRLSEEEKPYYLGLADRYRSFLGQCCRTVARQGRTILYQVDCRNDLPIER